ncbi:GDP-L-fucose synthase [Sulfurifustis variabilis]|uniref:GDP-L-fucose synthase n=1 Tax=Sulfurifustis variabilis TaxID=1675686 RepID=A0A1B4V575_9GAMM|nr:GDP-L-fucose synthase [Sulfurifustis variabilis]BAU48585.1 GDP-L-fucose synthase [Sulfurifustis variabilis]
MQPASKVYVAGHRGLVGSALLRRLHAGGYENIVTRTHAELDLIGQAAVDAFFARERPEYVLLAAAKVGGILANDTYRADFIYRNLMIGANVIHAAWRHGVRKLLFLGSSCIYPKLAPQPLKEEYLLTGPLEPTNEPYAVAKIAGIKMCAAYNRQYGTDFFSVMPTNLYGPGDNYDLESSHVLPALIRKMHEAKARGDREVTIWGTGTPRREFLYSDDLADACIFLLERYGAAEIGELINIGVGEDLTIHDLARLVGDVVGFRGEIVLDSSKPDGTPRKILDVTRLHRLGWKARTNLPEGIRRAYDDFLASHAGS